MRYAPGGFEVGAGLLLLGQTLVEGRFRVSIPYRFQQGSFRPDLNSF